MNPERYARCICQLFRVHTGVTSFSARETDEIAVEELTQHQPPLVQHHRFAQLSLTEDGLRVVGELIAAFEGVT